MSLGADDEYYAELALARARKDAILTSADHGKDEVLAPRTLGDRNGYDSFDYDCYESQQWLNYQILKSDRQDGWIETLRWIMLAAVGFCTGCTAFFIDAVVKYIVKGKFWIISEIFDATDTTNGRGNFWTAFLVWLGMELFLCSIAGYLVCYIESCAAGSGIPEIKCRLNGIRMRRVLRLKTYFTKVLGVLFSVAGGLPVGKEGPMIHSGAIVGAGLNGLKSTTLGFDWLKHRPNSRMRAFRNDVDKRDMIAAGASAGVAAAFGAPIGGVLFALEEGCSFWNVKITWGNFFCAMVSSTTINVWMTGINMDVDFGLLSVPGMITFGNFAVSEATAYNIWECPYFIIIGCVGGLIGALFNHINMKLTVWRLHNVNFSSHRRMLEVMTVALVVSLFSILFPYIANDCTAIANPYNSYPLPPTQLGDRGACYAKDCKCEAELRGAIIQQSTTKWNYDCLYDPDLKDSLVQFACENYHYSPAASLSFNKGDEVIKGLLHNPEKVNMGTLFCFFSIYFILACWTYGIGVPSGLFVPSLIIGAAYGRFVGQALDDANMLSGQGDTVSDRLGVYALVGASAMLAGMARITISLTVILIECTNDVQYAVSIMLAVLFAKWVADCFNHGLYDIHIHLKHVPLLEPFSEKEMFLIQARHVMSSLNETGGPDYRVETLPKVCKLGDIITLLKETKHSSYPVVGYDDVFIGLMRRDIPVSYTHLTLPTKRIV
eukprot:TRINITY_DN15928_c0_g2_i3.p1 TRINITY_DN15928_c0_g2~~TRINITY_DN15928_c0_g2_i3.p1  ORF type:complete len:719 (+),score=167.46 TRINITY_DN15928_c0_g2_i3:204-2360(+)